MASIKVERSEAVITLTLSEKEAQVLMLLTGRCNGSNNYTAEVHRELDKGLESIGLGAATSAIKTIDLYRYPPMF